MACFQLNTSEEQKGIRELHEDFNKKTYNRQTTSHQDSFCMSISEHSNSLASTTYLKCNRKIQVKCPSNHHFPLRLPQQTKHHSGETHYVALKWYSINFQWVFGVQLIVGGGVNKYLRNAESTLAGIWKKYLHKFKHMRAWQNGW